MVSSRLLSLSVSFCVSVAVLRNSFALVLCVRFALVFFLFLVLLPTLFRFVPDPWRRVPEIAFHLILAVNFPAFANTGSAKLNRRTFRVPFR